MENFFMMFIAAIACLAQLSVALTVQPIDPYFCLGKEEGNYNHPGGECGLFVACGRGCKKAKQQTYRLCTQDVLGCPAGLFFKQNLPHGYCDYPKNVECYQFQGDLCYGATKDSYGVFYQRVTGYIFDLKLEHVSGDLSCNTNVPQFLGRWGGCGEPQYPPMNTWVTDSSEVVVFPLPAIADTHTPHGFYHLPPYNDNSDFIKFETSSTYFVYGQVGKEYRVIYGEDVFNLWHINNGGSHCVKVFASFYQH